MIRYSKILNQNGVLERIEKGKNISSNATECTENEYNCLQVGIQIFVCGMSEESVVESEWGEPAT